MASNATETGTAGAGDPIPLHPGQSAPFSIVTDTDQGGILIIATAISLVFALISLLIRLFIRMEFRSPFSMDDVAAFFSMVLAIVQASVVFASVSKGFGKTASEVPSSDQYDWQRDVYVSDVFYLLTMWLTKCSVAYLFLRLSPDRVHIYASNGLLVTSTVFMFISVVIAFARCDPAHPWLSASHSCLGSFPKWIVATVFDILTEVGLFGVAILLVQGLQLPLQKKCVVMLAFGLRLPVIAISILRFSYLQLELEGSDPSLLGVAAAVATTTPCLKPFMAALNTHYGGPKTLTTPTGTKVSNSGNGYSLGTLSPASKLRSAEKSILEPERPSPPVMRWDGVEYNVEVNTGCDSSRQSSESNKMIISKDTSWAVDFEEPGQRAGRAIQQAGLRVGGVDEAKLGAAAGR